MTEKNEHIRQRINELVEKSMVRRSRFATIAGIDPSNFAKKLNGYTKFTDKDLTLISKNMHISMDWMLTGIGDVFEDAPEEIKNSIFFGDWSKQTTPLKPIENKENSIPLIPTHAMAGALAAESPTINDWDIEERFIIPVFKKSDFAIRVEGDSMEPRYYRGDIIACSRVPLNDMWFQWGKVYVIDTCQGVLVKHVEQGCDNEHIKLVSDNPAYKPFEIRTSDMYGIAIVNGLIRIE